MQEIDPKKIQYVQTVLRTKAAIHYETTKLKYIDCPNPRVYMAFVSICIENRLGHAPDRIQLARPVDWRRPEWVCIEVYADGQRHERRVGFEDCKQIFEMLGWWQSFHRRHYLGSQIDAAVRDAPIDVWFVRKEHERVYAALREGGYDIPDGRIADVQRVLDPNKQTTFNITAAQGKFNIYVKDTPLDADFARGVQIDLRDDVCVVSPSEIVQVDRALCPDVLAEFHVVFRYDKQVMLEKAFFERLSEENEDPIFIDPDIVTSIDVEKHDLPHIETILGDSVVIPTGDLVKDAYDRWKANK